jgi:hypothetical protein
MRVRLLVAVEAEAERIQQLPHDAHFGDDELEPQVRSAASVFVLLHQYSEYFCTWSSARFSIAFFFRENVLPSLSTSGGGGGALALALAVALAVALAGGG